MQGFFLGNKNWENPPSIRIMERGRKYNWSEGEFGCVAVTTRQVCLPCILFPFREKGLGLPTHIQTYLASLIELHFIMPHRCCIMPHRCLQIEGTTFHQQKEYYSFY